MSIVLDDDVTDLSPPSPLDPFLRPFLREVEGMADGYAPISGGTNVALALDWPSAFCEAIFASARGRGMIEPFRARGARGRPRWRVSTRGRLWLDTRDRAGGPVEDRATVPSEPAPA